MVPLSNLLIALKIMLSKASQNVTIQVTTLLSQHEAGSRMTMSPSSGTTITQIEIEGIIKM